MLGRLARAAYMFFVAVMIAAWAMAWAVSATKSGPAEPKNEPPAERWYS